MESGNALPYPGLIYPGVIEIDIIYESDIVDKSCNAIDFFKRIYEEQVSQGKSYIGLLMSFDTIIPLTYNNETIELDTFRRGMFYKIYRKTIFFGFDELKDAIGSLSKDKIDEIDYIEFRPRNTGSGYIFSEMIKLRVSRDKISISYHGRESNEVLNPIVGDFVSGIDRCEAVDVAVRYL